MVHQVARFSNAYSAWENWNLTSYEAKKEALLSLQTTLQESMLHLSSVMAYHLQQAGKRLAKPYDLVGPTGETNELYTAGRGVALLIQETPSRTAQQALVAQLTAALIAGNSVVVCSDDLELTQALEAAFQHSTMPANLLQFVSYDAYQPLLASDVRSVGFVGSVDGERTLNRQLAQRAGAIVGLVSETDLSALPVAHDPNLVLRFITERTRTINVTAVGGNATLLELGNGTDHH